MGDYFSTTFNSSGTFHREINQKFYAIKDHLGSERVIISDIKEPSSFGSKFYTNNISVSNYYPFGSLISDISRSSEQYRYGYNGKENDNEIAGKNATTDFGARTYANRLARFLSTDPLKSKFPNQSSYIYAGNNPIFNIDNNGESPISYIAKQGIKQGFKQAMKTYIKKQIKNKLQNYTKKKWAKQALSDADNILSTMDDAWWEIGLELVPGVGDVYGAVKFGKDVNDVFKKIKKLEKRVNSKLKIKKPKETGSYTNTHKSGKKYSGKGDDDRMDVSGKQKKNKDGTTDEVDNYEYEPADSQRKAFKDEDTRINNNGGTQGKDADGDNYNKNKSPGSKIKEQEKGKK